MRKLVAPFIFIISFMFTSITSANVILSLDPTTQNATLGETLSVNLMIDGLGDGVPLSLSSFDIDLAFDNSALSFTGYNLFDGLGDIDLFGAIDSSFGDLGGGIVNIAEVSFLTNFELWDFQPGSFVLAELFFAVDAVPSSSQVSVDGAVLFDVNGDLINIAGINNATINTVPSPANSMLMGLGLAVLLVRRKIAH